MARGSPFGLTVWRSKSPNTGNESDVSYATQSSGTDAPPANLSFELAGAMELGRASGTLAPSLMEARQQALPMRRLSVRRSKDKNDYAVHDEAGRVLLVARLGKDAHENGIDIFTAEGADAEAKTNAHPVLRLVHDEEKDMWRLIASRCSCCEYRLARHMSALHGLPRREHARIRHFSVPLDNGEGLLCMEVQCPGVCKDGGQAVWCPMRPRDERDVVFKANSRLPTGGNGGGKLSLDFGQGGRCRMASSKNFAICMGEAPSAHSATSAGAKDILQFGKIEENHYNLDYRHPLSLVEAFGVAMTTTVWI